MNDAASLTQADLGLAMGTGMRTTKGDLFWAVGSVFAVSNSLRRRRFKVASAAATGNRR